MYFVYMYMYLLYMYMHMLVHNEIYIINVHAYMYVLAGRYHDSFIVNVLTVIIYVHTHVLLLYKLIMQIKIIQNWMIYSNYENHPNLNDFFKLLKSSKFGILPNLDDLLKSPKFG